MSESNGSKVRRKSAIDRPPKPYPEFPLGAANNGRWCKKIDGTIFYFGKWGKVVNGVMTRIQPDGCWEEALRIYKAQIDDIRATGRKPVESQGALTVKVMCNKFLTAKLRRLESGEITPRTFAAYRATTDRLIATFGNNRHVENLTTDDFERLRAGIAKTAGPVRLGNEVVRVKSVFKFARKADIVDPEFKKPSRSVLRKHRALKGKKLFTAEQLRQIIDAAGIPLKAMILLAINAGLGNSDIASLPRSAVDLDMGWLDFPRPKTGVARRAKLWAETVKALQQAIAERPMPKVEVDADLVFVTKYGHRWVRMVEKDKPPEELDSRERQPNFTAVDAVGLEFGKLLRELKLSRKGIAFYSIRHTYRTTADATKDFPAIRLTMGHADDSIDNFYVEHIDDSRLVAVAEHVRSWLFPAPAVAPVEKPKQKAKHAAKPRKAKAAKGKPTLRLFASPDEKVGAA